MRGWTGRLFGLLVLLVLGACGGTDVPAEHDRAISAGKPFLHSLDALVESDGPVEYAATLEDGRALPEWLSFDPETRTFRGVAPADLAGGSTLRLQVVATGASGVLAKTSFELIVMQATGDVPQILNPAEEMVEFDPSGILRWSEVAGADAYEVWAYNDAGLTYLAEFSKALVSRQYQFTELTGGRTYYVKIYFRASGVWKEMPTFTINTTNSVVKARLSNSQEELEGLGPSATLRWTAVQGADVYELWIYRDPGLEAFAETSGPVRITQYQVTSLTPGTIYYAQVYARVNGVYTAGGALTITVTSQLDKARILNPQEELDNFATNGILRWSPVTGATAYELWVFTNPNSSEIYESSGSLTARSYATRTLKPGAVYYAQAYAFVNGQWQVGAPVKITTANQVNKARLTTPQEQLEAFSTTGTLRWTEVAGAAAYELWIYGNAGLGSIIESGANADRSYQPKKLCSGAVYYVQVYALVNGQWTTGWATRLDVTQGQSSADCVPPTPQVTLTADPIEVISGSNVNLNWTSKFATRCIATGAWSGAKALAGQESVGPLTKKSLFGLSCSGPSGTYKAETLVTVVPTVGSLQGTILIPVVAQIDSDVNDPNAAYKSNDTISSAQVLPNPVLLGGYLNEIYKGPAGDSYYFGDYDDFYRVQLLKGQLVEIVVSDANPADPAIVRDDIDLELYSSAGYLVDGAYGVDRVERIYAPLDGTYYVRATIYNGASTYTLSIGQAPAEQQVLTGALNLSADFVSDEIVVQLVSERASGADASSKVSIDLGPTYGLSRMRGDASRELVYRVPESYESMSRQKVSRNDLPDGLKFVNDDQHQRWRTLHAVKSLSADPQVQSVSPNYLYQSSVRPNDPYYVSQRWHYEMISLPAAWDIVRGSPEVTVAVVDTGIRLETPDLAGRLLEGYDFVSDPFEAGDGDGLDADPSDPGHQVGSGGYSFHGTHVAGTVGAASNNGLGVAGVAWDVRIMPVRVLGITGRGSLADILDGIRYAAGLPNSSGRIPPRRADVINLSLGGPRACNALEQSVLSEARQAGVIVVAAAGNEQLGFADAPSSCVGAVSVSAVDAARGKAWYSNFGPGVDVAAPGGDTGADADGVSGPDGVFSTYAERFGSYYAPSYAPLQGTSMAAPHVAGVAALMKSAKPSLSPAEFDSLLANGLLTDDIGVPGPDALGQGLINANKAVRAANDPAPELQPMVSIAPRSLSFGPVTSAAELRVGNAGGGTLVVSGTLTSSTKIKVSPVSVDSNGLGAYVVTVDRIGVPAGNYVGWIDIQTSIGTSRVELLIAVSDFAVTPDAGRHYVLLIDALTLEAESQVAVETRGGNAAFRFDNVRAGSYFLAAGTDMNNDMFICDPGEACTQYPVYAGPEVVRLQGNLSGFELQTTFYSALAGEGTSLLQLGGRPVERGFRRAEE